MQIRSAQVTDLGRIDQIYNEGLQMALRGDAATHPVRLWQMVTRTLSSLLPLSTPSEMLYVLEEDDRVMGFIQGETLSSADNPVARGAVEAIRVLNLSLSSELSGTAGGALIDHLCGEALARGIGRIYVRIPDGHPVAESFKAHGFTRYAIDRVFYRPEPDDLPPGPFSPDDPRIAVVDWISVDEHGYLVVESKPGWGDDPADIALLTELQEEAQTSRPDTPGEIAYDDLPQITVRVKAARHAK